MTFEHQTKAGTKFALVLIFELWELRPCYFADTDGNQTEHSSFRQS